MSISEHPPLDEQIDPLKPVTGQPEIGQLNCAVTTEVTVPCKTDEMALPQSNIEDPNDGLAEPLDGDEIESGGSPEPADSETGETESSPDAVAGSAADPVGNIRKGTRNRLTPPKGIPDGIPPFNEIEGMLSSGPTNTRAKALPRQAIKTGSATTTPLPIGSKRDPNGNGNEGGNGNGNGDGNGNDKLSEEITRDVEPSADLLKFAHDFQKTGWPILTPKMPDTSSQLRSFIDSFVTGVTEERMANTIKIIKSNKGFQAMCEAVRLLMVADSSEAIGSVQMLLANEELDLASEDGMNEVFDALQCGASEEAIDKLIKIIGYTFYNTLGVQIAYVCNGVQTKFAAALHGYDNDVAYLFDEDGIPKTILEAGCADGGTLLNHYRTRQRIWRNMPARREIATPGPLRKGPMEKAIAEGENKAYIKDDAIIGVDFASAFAEKLTKQRKIDTEMADFSDPDLLKRDLKYLKANKARYVVFNKVFDRFHTLETALENGRALAAPNARFHIGITFPFSNVGDSLTEGVPQVTFWRGGMREVWMQKDINAVKKKILFDLRSEGYAVDTIAEHREAVISPHSYLSVKELREKFEKDPSIIDMSLYNDELRQRVADALKKPYPDFNVVPQDVMAEDERIMIPQLYTIWDLAGVIVKPGKSEDPGPIEEIVPAIPGDPAEG